MSNTRMFALACALAFGMACSAVLDFELEVECWCGERWLVQIAGAEAIRLSGAREVIPAGATTHERCVTQLEHLALSQAQPADPIYAALRDSLESAAIANCETYGTLLIGFQSTTCSSTGTPPVTTNITHVGPCWDSEVVAFDDPEPCSLDSKECGEFYDCTNDPIVGAGDDEGGDELVWNCGPQ